MDRLYYINILCPLLLYACGVCHSLFLIAKPDRPPFISMTPPFPPYQNPSR